MSLLQRLHALALCSHPEDSQQIYRDDAGPVRVCAGCGARCIAPAGPWQRPELAEQLMKFAATVVQRAQSENLLVRLFSAEVDADEVTEEALAAWRAVQRAEEALANAPDRTDASRRLARLGEEEASAHVALLSALLAKNTATA